MIDYKDKAVRAEIAEIYPNGININPNLWKDEELRSPEFGEHYYCNIRDEVRLCSVEVIKGKRIIVKRLSIGEKGNALVGVPKRMRIRVVMEVNREQTFEDAKIALLRVIDELTNLENKKIVPVKEVEFKTDAGINVIYGCLRDQRTS